MEIPDEACSQKEDKEGQEEVDKLGYNKKGFEYEYSKPFFISLVEYYGPTSWLTDSNTYG